MLPFDVNIETFTIRTVEIPRYGCLTVQETISFERMLVDHRELLDCEDQAAAMTFFVPIIATMLLISRNKPEWSMATVKNFFSSSELCAIADFALGERRRWKDPNMVPDSNSVLQDGKATDWAEIYWLLKLHYPYEELFARAKFASCPVLLVEQAIAALSRLELERAHRAAVPISLLGCYTLSNESSQLDTSHFNPYEKLLNQKAAREEVDSAIANTVMELLNKGQIPGWVIPLLPINKMRLAAKA